MQHHRFRPDRCRLCLGSMSCPVAWDCRCRLGHCRLYRCSRSWLLFASMRICLRTCSPRRNRSTCIHRRTCSRRTPRTGSRRRTCNNRNIRSTLWRCSTRLASRPNPWSSKRCRSAQTRASSWQEQPTRFRRIFRISCLNLSFTSIEENAETRDSCPCDLMRDGTALCRGPGPQIFRKLSKIVPSCFG